MRWICFKGKQRKTSPWNHKESRFKEKAQQVIFFFSTYFFYNPNFITFISNIEASFSDELLYINSVQLSHIITDINLICKGCIG
jgi:hypothetical protein